MAIPIELIERAALAGEDVLGGFAPDEGLRLGVVLPQVVVDHGLELIDAGVAASADALCGDLGEEAFDQVHPGRAGSREMQLEAGMLFQPGLHLGRLVGGVVVENHAMAKIGMKNLAYNMRRLCQLRRINPNPA